MINVFSLYECDSFIVILWSNPFDLPTNHSLLGLHHPSVVSTLRMAPRLPAGHPPHSRALPHARIPHVHNRQRLLELGKCLKFRMVSRDDVWLQFIFITFFSSQAAAVERYLALDRHFARTKSPHMGFSTRRTFLYIAGICVFTVAFNLPAIFEHEVREIPAGHLSSSLPFRSLTMSLLKFFHLLHLRQSMLGITWR